MSSLRLPLIAVVTRGVVVFAVIAAGMGVYWLLIHTAPRAAKSDMAIVPRRVNVFRASEVEVARQWQGYGTAAAMDTADVPARVMAVVTSIPADVLVGARVQKGQVLAQLDESDFQHELQIAKQNLNDLNAQLDQWQAQYERITKRVKVAAQDVTVTKRELARVEKLRQRGASNPQDVDRTQRTVLGAQQTQLSIDEVFAMMGPQRSRLIAQRKRLEATVQLARLNLERCTIKSPLDGVLASVDIEVGENVEGGQRVAEVVSLAKIEVPIQLPGSAQPSVAVGNRVVLSATDHSRRTWSAVVARIGPQTDASTRTLTVYVELAQSPDGDAGQLLLPGMFIDATVTSDMVEARWVVPRRAVSAGRVLVVSGDVVRSRAVRVAFMIEGVQATFSLPDDQWVVLDEYSLHVGDIVLTDASAAVLDGERVEPSFVANLARNGQTKPSAETAQ